MITEVSAHCQSHLAQSGGDEQRNPVQVFKSEAKSYTGPHTEPGDMHCKPEIKIDSSQSEPGAKQSPFLVGWNLNICEL